MNCPLAILTLYCQPARSSSCLKACSIKSVSQECFHVSKEILNYFLNLRILLFVAKQQAGVQWNLKVTMALDPSLDPISVRHIFLDVV